MFLPPPFFADAPPASFLEWLGSLRWLLDLITVAVVLWFQFKPRSEKREISFTEEFAREEDLQELREDVDALENKLAELSTQQAADKLELMQAGEQRASRIHQRIEQIQAALHADMQNMPNQLIALLKNTGALDRHP